MRHGDLVRLLRLVERNAFFASARLPIGCDGLTRRLEYGGYHVGIREGLYERFVDSDPDAKFAPAHEIGHMLLHRHLLDGPRRRLSLAFTSTHPHFEDSEWQANAFASAILIPFKTLVELVDVDRTSASEVGRAFGVSQTVAEFRLRVVRERLAAFQSVASE